MKRRGKSRRRKYPKLSDRDKNMPSIDRLSGLPDDVICRILSLLPTKLSVSTSVLAKRWMFLWSHVPELVFKREHFRGEAQHFDIIHRVVALHQAKAINTFTLRSVKCSAYELETLATSAIQRSVRNLCLDFDFYTNLDTLAFTLPRCLLTCRTLVDLRLSCCGGIPSSGEVFLPSLEKLKLSCVKYEGDESLPLLLSGCPVLKVLTINDCYREGQKNSGHIVISSPTITSLFVDYIYGVLDDFEHKLTIKYAPSLNYLNVYHFSLENISTLRRKMPSLVEADFSLNGDWHECGIGCNEHARAIEFLNCLSNLRCLRISSDMGERLVDLVRTGSMVKFDNLIELEIGLNFDWRVLVKLLEVADNLEILVIDLSWIPYEEPKRVPTCMLSTLRTVKINNWEETGFDIVRYILRNAQVLEWVEIYSDDISDEEKLDVLQRISMFERGSESCELDFY